jgi:uncharacterized iron-regulated membrane protein
MGWVVLVLAVVVVMTGFVALYLWARRVERDEVDWTAPERDAEDRQTAQLGIALNVNGTYSR